MSGRVDSRFECVCLEGCGLIRFERTLATAIESAKAHSCVSVVVYDSMTKGHIHGNRWERSKCEGGAAEAYKMFKPETGNRADAHRAAIAKAEGK